MALFLQVLPNKSKETKKLCEASVEQYKGILKLKKGTAIAIASQAYEMFHLFVVGD